MLLCSFSKITTAKYANNLTIEFHAPLIQITRLPTIGASKFIDLEEEAVRATEDVDKLLSVNRARRKLEPRKRPKSDILHTVNESVSSQIRRNNEYVSFFCQRIGRDQS